MQKIEPQLQKNGVNRKKSSEKSIADSQSNAKHTNTDNKNVLIKNAKVFLDKPLTKTNFIKSLFGSFNSKNKKVSSSSTNPIVNKLSNSELVSDAEKNVLENRTTLDSNGSNFEQNDTIDNGSKHSMNLKFDENQNIPFDENTIDSCIQIKRSRSGYFPNEKLKNTESNISLDLNEESRTDSLLQHYILQVKLEKGINLAIRDIIGSSDPYAKFTLNGTCVYKSKVIYRNLNPVWDETFFIKIPKKSETKSEGSSFHSFESTKLVMYVYDYDRGFFSDDLIGYSNISLDSLNLNFETPVKLKLIDDNLKTSEDLGSICLTLKLIPKYEEETVFKRDKSATQVNRYRNRKLQSILNVVVIQATGLQSLDENRLADPYIKFKLASEKHRTKVVPKIIRQTVNPVYLERFQFYIYRNEDMTLNLSVHDLDTSRSIDHFFGRGSLDIRALEPNKTHEISLPLEDDGGNIRMLLTVTAIGGINGSDVYNAKTTFNKSYRDTIMSEYGLFKSLNNLNNVGWLQVKVFRAENLLSGDMNGKSDPFCTFEICNQYVQTHTQYKTLSPIWDEVFDFHINDIHAILEVTVYDEDRNKTFDFLGKIEIPLINIQNGKRKFYALKDRKLMKKTRGAIELELYLFYNPIKAIARTFQPREEKLLKPEPKLKLSTLKQNLIRTSTLAEGICNTSKFVQSCCSWEKPFRSLISFIAFVFIVMCFEPFMMPFALLMIFFKNFIFLKLGRKQIDDENIILYQEQFGDDDSLDFRSSKKETKRSFKEKFNEIQDICLKVQENLDFVASSGERVVNIFNFTVPWLSYLAIFLLIISSVVLYLVPFKYLILLIGIAKFSKKFRKPQDYNGHVEILDFLSRVPSKVEKLRYKEERIRPLKLSQSRKNYIY